MWGERSGYSVSIQKIGTQTRVDITGEIPEDKLQEIKTKYKNAKIFLNGRNIGKLGIEEID